MPTLRHSAVRSWAWGVGVSLVAAAVFGHDLAAEPDFADEWAYVSQAYFWDELARPHGKRWLEYPARDLPPLPKYAIGAALRGAGHPLLSPAEARQWYLNIDLKFGTQAMLVAARRPSAVMGALGCAAAFALGTMAFDRRAGGIAAGLLIVDPLYRMLARRAMSDIYAEGFILLTAAVGLAAWRGLLAGRMGAVRGVALLGVSGCLGGLAVLSKLNGGLALMTLAAWAILAITLRRCSSRGRFLVVAGTGLAGATAFGTFMALNPFVTAMPSGALPGELAAIRSQGVVERCGELIRLRLEVPRVQQQQFSHNALTTPGGKLGAVAVQGFGRFGPLGRQRFDAVKRRWWFDSTLRYDWRQDAGALVWLPLVVAGAVAYARRGRGQIQSGTPPTAWAVLLQAGVALVTVTAFLPLAWDRFFISIQAGSCLLAAGAIVALVDHLAARAAGRAGPT
jgi:hypothetical protein